MVLFASDAGGHSGDTSQSQDPDLITATRSILAFTYGVVMVFALHRHDEAWAFVVGVSFAIYPLVPKLPEEPDEVKPEKYTLFLDSH